MNTASPGTESGKVRPWLSKGAESLAARSPHSRTRRQKARTLVGGSIGSKLRGDGFIGGTAADSTVIAGSG